jgi:septal ring factor EnvC (AmiA/AmiB activator)
MSLENLSPEAQAELASLAKTLAEDPNTRKQFLQLTKQVRPDVPIPEIEIEERTNQVISEANKRVESLEAKLRQKEAKETLERRRSDLLKKQLVESEDDIKEVEKLMVEKGIANHETAAEYHSWMKQMSAPTPSQFPQPVMSKFNTKDFMKNPVGAARDAAHAALNEFRKNPKPIGF